MIVGGRKARASWSPIGRNGGCADPGNRRLSPLAPADRDRGCGNVLGSDPLVGTMRRLMLEHPKNRDMRNGCCPYFWASSSICFWNWPLTVAAVLISFLHYLSLRWCCGVQWPCFTWHEAVLCWWSALHPQPINPHFHHAYVGTSIPSFATQTTNVTCKFLNIVKAASNLTSSASPTDDMRFVALPEGNVRSTSTHPVYWIGIRWSPNGEICLKL